MSNIIPFSFDQHAVRTIERDGQAWFVAADVCAALAIKNHRESVRHLDDDERGVISNDTLGGQQQMTAVNESGLYALVLRSRKPEARRFTKWITSEVLPTIRKTGTYTAPQPTTLSPAQQRHIQNRVTELAKGSRTEFARLYRTIKDQFGVGTYKDVPAEKYPALCNLLLCRPMEGEWLAPELLELTKPVERLEINYPASWLPEHNPHAYQFGYRPTGADPSIHLNTMGLCGMDSRSPSLALIGELTRAGFDVEACRLEVMAMRHQLERYWGLCRELQRMGDAHQHGGITFKLTDAGRDMRR